MFDSAFRSIGRKARDGYFNPTMHEICGTTVAYKNSNDEDTWNEWSDILHRWLPRFEEAGWLDDLNRIEIGNRLINDDRVGEYRREERIVGMKDNPEIYDNHYLVGHTKEYVFIHEMIHHAHITDIFDMRRVEDVHITKKQHEVGWDGHMHDFHIYVSEYAATNFLEAVAETGSGIMLGEEYPNRIMEAYEQFGGPDPL